VRWKSCSTHIHAYPTSESTYLLCWFRWRALLFICSSLRRSCSAGSDHGESAGSCDGDVDVDANVSGDSVSCDDDDDDDDDDERGRHADAKEYGTTFACLDCIRLGKLVKELVY
jgi:hypothetical protein